MALIHGVLLLVAAFVSVNYAQRCEMIVVDKDDGFGTTGSCCVVWDEGTENKRKLLGGILGSVGIGGFLRDSKANRTISGGLGIGTGVGLGGGGGGDDATPAPPQIVRVPAPAPAPAPVYPPPAMYPQGYSGYGAAGYANGYGRGVYGYGGGAPYW